MIKYKKKLAEHLSVRIAEVYGVSPEAGEIAGMLEYPPDDSMGDIAFPCFRLSKLLKSAPPKIAAALAEGYEEPLADKISQAGGYLNFTVNGAYLASETLSEIEEKGGAYGAPEPDSPLYGGGKTVVLDYSSPNVAKPFHIGHLGTTVIGHSIKLLHEFAGWRAIGVNHLGDWGTQFGKQIVAFRRWGDRDKITEIGIDELVRLYVKFHEEAEADPSLEQLARDEFTKLEHGDPENTALWKWFIEISLAEYQKTYDQLGITFDSYTGESFYFLNDLMTEQVERLREKNLLKVDDGATIVDLSEYKMPPCIIFKSDGSTLYHTRDIAAAAYRKRAYDFDRCIYVTSAGQCLHFAQLFKVIEMMGYDWYDKLVHVPYGTVSINGAKLATRTGNVVLLKNLFAEAVARVEEIMEQKNPNLPDKEKTAEAVGVGAIIFYYLYNNRIKDISFNMEDALSFEGATGPYAQYTYARTCSILEKTDGNVGDSLKATAPEETALLKTLAKFGERAAAALEGYEPSVVTRYIIELCTAFNRFYHECPILSAEDAVVRSFRLRLVRATRTVLGTALHLICIKTPEKI